MANAANVERDLRNSVEFIHDRLYYVAMGTTPPSQNPKRHFFSIDTELIYWNFFLDFGPLNFGQLYRFCEKLNRKLTEQKLRDKVIYFYSSTHSHKRANAAFLLCAWSLLYQGKTPDEAFAPFKNYSPPFPPWHDATPTICTYQLTILDTLRGLYKARECKFIELDQFKIEEYEYYEQVENGDLNWCQAGKFIAFAGPHATREMSAGGYHTLCPSDYIPYFKKRNVTLVVRLNKKYYPAESFTNHGIDHIELEFLDGSNPPDFILSKFIDKCEQTPGAAAVHCKAGLGRTGSCIGAYMMKHYRFTAEEVIGWLRIVRPGMVIGPQQQWMRDMQFKMWQEGEVFYAKLTNFGNNIPLPQLGGIESRSNTIRGNSRNTNSALYQRNQQQFQVHRSELPAMEEKSTLSSASRDEADGDKASQGDLLRIRREQQQKQHFPIDPTMTSLSLKTPPHGNMHLASLRATATTAPKVTLNGVPSSSMNRPITPGSTTIKILPVEPHSASSRILRPGTVHIPGGNNSPNLDGHAAITVASTPDSSVASPTSISSPGGTKTLNTFSSFFGNWRTQG